MSIGAPLATDLRLVVGFDGSPASSRALDAAANLLQGRTGRIEVVYVAHMPAMAALSPAAVIELETDFNDVEQELRTMAGAQLSDRVAGWGFERRQGSIAEELLAAARDIGAAPRRNRRDHRGQFVSRCAPRGRFGRCQPGPPLTGAPDSGALAGFPGVASHVPPPGRSRPASISTHGDSSLARIS